MKCSTHKMHCCCPPEIQMPGPAPCAGLKEIRTTTSLWPSRLESMPGSTPGKRAPGAFCRGYHKPYEHTHPLPESIPDPLEDRRGCTHQPGADLRCPGLGLFRLSGPDGVALIRRSRADRNGYPNRRMVCIESQ